VAITNCPECGHTVSTWTIRCPGCRRFDIRPILQILFWLAVAGGAVWWWYVKKGGAI